MGRQRIFIAVGLPDAIKEKIGGLIEQFKASGAAVRWVEPKNLHVTLKFLGWVEEERVSQVVELTEKAVRGKKAFCADLQGIGTFPAGRDPRIIWVGITEGGDNLKALAEELEKLFAQAGYGSEEREFSSHVTIGRIKERKGADKLREKMAAFNEVKLGDAPVASLQIMKSTLTPDGPRYEIIKEVEL